MTRSGIILVILGLLLCVPAPPRIAAADTAHPLDTHLAERYTADLDELVARRYIRVLTTYNRTNFFLAGGKPRGFEYALLREYQKHLNRSISRLDLRIVLEFIPVPRDRLIPDLIEGYGDIAAAGLTVTPRRRRRVDFTTPYIGDVDEVLVSHRSAKPLRDLADLSGKRVFVRPSSSYFDSLVELNRGFAAAGQAPVTIVAADENLETEDILELVNTGAIARTVCDSHIAEAWSKVFAHIRVNPAVTLREGADIAWAVRQTNPALKASLNRFIRSHRKGTRIGNIYFNRYYKQKNWIRNPLTGGAGRKLAAYAPLFKTYAAQYGFDWLLLGAMAFQESGFDQEKVSHRGAVGIMQVRPGTAADPKIAIPDVHSVENNIHAAVKYLAFLRRQYYGDARIRPRDQVRFSLAAYNAGPSRIRRARRLAQKMHLNPDRWFRHVEIAMLKIVGQETVRYVSNINKYYVIYRNAIERVEAREAAKARVKG